MVVLETIVIANFKRIRNHRFVKQIISVAKQIDPDRTLKKLQRRN